MATILLVEDDTSMRLLTTAKLKHRYAIISVQDGVEALDVLERHPVDLIIADVMMPRMDGYTLVKTLRERGDQIPVLLLTAKQSFEDKREGFSSGVDDYMTKPFNILEVKARIKSILRRTGAKSEAPRLTLTAGDITINLGNRSVQAHGQAVNLTVKEFDLLNLFMSNPGKVYSRDELLETIWGFDYIGDFRTVDVHIRRLREKIEADPANPSHIMTKWGVGYYFAQ